MILFFDKASRQAVLLLLLTATSAVQAGALFRSYLSGNGSDSNPCTLQQPCRLLPAALSATADGGEVWMLDSANYNTGTVSINQSVTILAIPGVVGCVIAVNADALQIPAANVKVVLRNLLIRNQAGNTDSGVYVTGAGVQLVVEGTEFSGEGSGYTLLGYGVYVSASGAYALIHDTVFRNNRTAMQIETTGAISSSALVDHSSVIGNSDTSGQATGVLAYASNVLVSHSLVTNTWFGLITEAQGSILLEDDTLVLNEYGITLDTGIVRTRGDNTIALNTTDVSSGSLTPVQGQ